MSIVGISPTDIVNGIRVTKRAIEALRDKDGAKDDFATVSASVDHHIDAIQNLENAFNDTPDRSTQLSTGIPDKVQDRWNTLRLLQEHQRSRLERYHDLPAHTAHPKSNIKKTFRKLGWAFGGKQEFQDANGRMANSSNAVVIDAVVLTGQRNQTETRKLCQDLNESLAGVHQATQGNLMQNLDISNQVRATAASSESRIIANLQTLQQIIADHLRHGPNSTFASSASIGSAHLALSRLQSSSDLSETAEFPSDVLIRRRSHVHSDLSATPFPTLDSYINMNGPIPLDKEISQGIIWPLVRLVEQLIAPLILVALYMVDNQRELEASPRGSPVLVQGNSGSVTLLLSAMAALIRMLCQVQRPVSLLGGGHVNFEDASGRVMKLPFTTCQYPSVFFGFLQVHFQASSVHEYVQKNLYHLNLNGSRGILITKQSWSSLVRPKGKISMSIVVTLGCSKCSKCSKTLYRHGNDLHCPECSLWYSLYEPETNYPDCGDSRESICPSRGDSAGTQTSQQTSSQPDLATIKNIHAHHLPGTQENDRLAVLHGSNSRKSSAYEVYPPMPLHPDISWRTRRSAAQRCLTVIDPLNDIPRAHRRSRRESSRSQFALDHTGNAIFPLGDGYRGSPGSRRDVGYVVPNYNWGKSETVESAHWIRGDDENEVYTDEEHLGLSSRGRRSPDFERELLVSLRGMDPPPRAIMTKQERKLRRL